MEHGDRKPPTATREAELHNGASQGQYCLANFTNRRATHEADLVSRLPVIDDKVVGGTDMSSDVPCEGLAGAAIKRGGLSRAAACGWTCSFRRTRLVGCNGNGRRDGREDAWGAVRPDSRSGDTARTSETITQNQSLPKRSIQSRSLVVANLLGCVRFDEITVEPHHICEGAVPGAEQVRECQVRSRKVCQMDETVEVHLLVEGLRGACGPCVRGKSVMVLLTAASSEFRTHHRSTRRESCPSLWL